MIARLDDLRARRSGYAARSRDDILVDITRACAWLGDVAAGGVADADLPAIGRTCEGIRRLLADIGPGGAAA